MRNTRSTLAMIALMPAACTSEPWLAESVTQDLLGNPTGVDVVESWKEHV